MEMSRLTRGTGLPNPFRETKFSGANRDREILIFPVQLTTSRIGNNLTRLILTLLLYVMTIHTYIHIYYIQKMTIKGQSRRQESPALRLSGVSIIKAHSEVVWGQYNKVRFQID